MEKQGYWYNYVVGEYEMRDSPTTDKEATELIPQHPAVLGIFRCNRGMGLGILDSMEKALSAYIGKEDPIPVPK